MPRLRPNALSVALLTAACLSRPISLLAATADEAKPSKVVRVVDGEGKPVPGARVVPWAIRTQQAHGSWSPNGYGQSEPPELTTDADGEVTIPFPKFADRDLKIPVMALTCRVSHPDFVETVYNDVPVTEIALPAVATIALGPGDLVEVAALSGDQPLPIKHVYAQWSSDAASGHEGTTITDEGMRRLPRLPPGPELLRLAYLPDEGEPLFSVVDPLMLSAGKRRRLRMQLEPGAHVEGRLDDSVPRSVTGGMVVGEMIHLLDDQGEEWKDETLRWRTHATIREDGTFTLPPMPPGELQLIAMCDGFVAQSGDPPAFATERERTNPGTFFGRAQVVTVVGGANDAITLAMTPAADCEFHVVDPEGRPISGVDASFWPNVGWWRGGSQIYGWPPRGTIESLKPPANLPPLDFHDQPFAAKTNADGVALIKNIPVGTREYFLSHDDWELWGDASRDWSGRVDLKPGQRSEVSATMQPRKPVTTE